jgi:nucleoside-diphosphate-sugar epimerase
MNIASGVETRILDMATRINELVGNKAGIVTAPRRVWDTKTRLLACIDRAKTMLGYEPKTDFDEGLKKTIDWFKANWDNIQRDAEFPPGMSSATRGVKVNKS